MVWSDMGRIAALRMPGGLGYAPVDPEPDPEPPPADSTLYGYAESVDGGAGGTTYTVDTDSGTEASRGAAVKLHINDAADRVIKVIGSGNIDLGGDQVKITKNNLTGEGDDWLVGAFKNGGFLLKGEGAGLDNVLFRNWPIWSGDDVDEPDDMDPITVNGNDAPVTNIAFDHLSLLWGPDIGGLAVFGDVSYMSILRSIIACGLYRSNHKEASRPGGHAKAFNITQIGSNPSGTPPNHISVFLSMAGFASDRNPQLHGAEYLDIANNVFYNWGKKGPDGNPRGMNFERNVVKKGPDYESNPYIFLKDTTSSNPTPHPNSIWLGSTATGGTNKAVGFATAVNLAAGTLRSSAFGGGIYNYSDIINAIGSTAVEQAIDAQAGHVHRRTMEQTLINHMLAGTGFSGGMFDGVGSSGDGPYPSWP